jgi:hypothetical protein
MTDERIMARRVTLDEFCDYMDKLEYIEGRIVTGPGIELFVGVKEFPESIRAFEEERQKGNWEERFEPADRNVPADKNVLSSAEGPTDEELVLVSAGKMRLPKEPAVLAKFLTVPPRHSRVDIFGHIHGDAGKFENGDTQFVNAAYLDERYRPADPAGTIGYRARTGQAAEGERQGYGHQ